MVFLVQACDEAETLIVQHYFMHLSTNNPNHDFGEFVDTLVVALRMIEKADSPMRHIHPVKVREADLSDEGRADFGLGFPVCEDEDEADTPTLSTVPALTEVGDHL